MAAGRRHLSQTRALRVLKEVAETLNSAPTEQRAASEALRRMADLLGLETGWVWLQDEASRRFYSAAVQNLPPYLQEPVRMTGKSCWCLELFRDGRLTSRNIDVMGCSRLASAADSQSALTEGLRCHASVPLYAGDRPLGVMNLAMRGWRRLTRQELDLLTTIADQLGVAIERARLGEQSVQHARVDERSRIARDVHDTLAQAFTAIALHIEAGLAGLDPQDRARPALHRALDAARQGLDEARRSIEALRPLALDRSLAEALAALARQFTADTGIRVRVEISDVGPLPAAAEVELFRIAGEALANVRKHAHAREALLRLERTRRGAIRLTVADPGAGFRANVARRRGFGLVGIEDRARQAGGRVIIRSAPGKGTTISVTVPVTTA